MKPRIAILNGVACFALFFGVFGARPSFCAGTGPGAGAVMTAEQLAQLPPPAARNISYGKDVKIILAHHCFECHANDKKKGGFQVVSRELLIKGGEDGAAVTVGKSSESRLIKLVAGFDPDSIMPKKGERLSKDEIAILRAWIDQGLPWDDLAAVSRTKKVDIKPRKPSIPAGVGNPIDLLLATYLGKNGVDEKRVVLVDDRVYARRVYLDILGLLPPPKDLQDFIADVQPDKRERLVKRLLSDNQGYAEHWMSFWSDLLRNGTTLAGIDGFKNVNVTPWLEKALRENMPYNQFVAELINPKKESEAFLKGVRMRGVIPASQTTEMQAAQNVSQVFMGVQIKCASCHDSFVSRWTLDDSYGLASVFSDKPVEMVRCEIPTGKTATARFFYPELGEINPKAPLNERLQRLAELLTKPENGQFTRTIVNRLWARFMGRGIIEPVDEMENEPWNGELLDWLASDLAENGHDIKKTIERILSSRAYQLPSVPSVDDRKTSPAAYVFKGPRQRRMSAEQFIDVLRSMLEQPRRAWHDSNNSLMEALGRPDRNTVATSRESEATTLQALELINGPDLQKLIYTDGAKKIGALLLESKTKHELATRWFLQALGRDPNAEELKLIDSIGTGGDKLTAETAEDLLWVIAMLPEFQLIR